MELLSSQRWNGVGNKRADFAVNSLCKRVRIHTTHPLDWIEHELYFAGAGLMVSDVVEVVRFMADAGKSWPVEYREYVVREIDGPKSQRTLVERVSLEPPETDDSPESWGRVMARARRLGIEIKGLKREEVERLIAEKEAA